MSSGRITESELKLIREAQETFMPSEVEVHQKVSVGDGEWDYAKVATCKARITPMFGFWRQASERFQGVTFMTVAVPWDTEIRAGDRLYDAYSREFEVRDVKDASSYQTAKQVLVEWMQDA